MDVTRVWKDVTTGLKEVASYWKVLTIDWKDGTTVWKDVTRGLKDVASIERM